MPTWRLRAYSVLSHGDWDEATAGERAGGVKCLGKASRVAEEAETGHTGS